MQTWSSLLFCLFLHPSVGSGEVEQERVSAHQIVADGCCEHKGSPAGMLTGGAGRAPPALV